MKLTREVESDWRVTSRHALENAQRTYDGNGTGMVWSAALGAGVVGSGIILQATSYVHVINDALRGVDQRGTVRSRIDVSVDPQCGVDVYHAIIHSALGTVAVKDYFVVQAKSKPAPPIIDFFIDLSCSKAEIGGPAGVAAAGINIEPGTYRINVVAHEDGGQPGGWGLSCFPKHGAKRNGASTWVAVHSGDHWPCKWRIEPGPKGGYLIKTLGHIEGGQEEGCGLSAWRFAGDSIRNEASSRVAVHRGDHWPCEWYFEKGKTPGSYRIKTCGHVEGKQPAGWGLAAWQKHGGKRNGASSWVYVHAGDQWPCDWELIRV